MKQINIFAISIVLTCFTLLPAVSMADGLDDLEVTMDVLDTESELDEVIAEMRGPEDVDSESDFNDEDGDEEGEAGEVGEVGQDGDDGADGEVGEVGEDGDAGDGFERDEVREEDEMADESDFEEGEDLDEDIFDEIDEHMDEHMDEEMTEDDSGDESGDDAISTVTLRLHRNSPVCMPSGGIFLRHVIVLNAKISNPAT